MFEMEKSLHYTETTNTGNIYLGIFYYRNLFYEQLHLNTFGVNYTKTMTPNNQSIETYDLRNDGD